MTCMVRSHSSSKAITCFSLACNDICLGRRSILYTLPWRSLQFSSGQAAERSMLLDQRRREGPPKEETHHCMAECGPYHCRLQKGDKE